MWPINFIIIIFCGSTPDRLAQDLCKRQDMGADGDFLSRLQRRPMFCLLGAVSLSEFEVKSTSSPVAGWETLPWVISLRGVWPRQDWEWSRHLIWFPARAEPRSSLPCSSHTRSLRQRRLHLLLSLAWLCLSPGQVPVVNGSYFPPINTVSAYAYLSLCLSIKKECVQTASAQKCRHMAKEKSVADIKYRGE